MKINAFAIIIRQKIRLFSRGYGYTIIVGNAEERPLSEYRHGARHRFYTRFKPGMFTENICTELARDIVSKITTYLLHHQNRDKGHSCYGNGIREGKQEELNGIGIVQLPYR